MKELNRGKQMKSVWEIKPPEAWEKRFGKHPTQKPVALLERILLASSNEGDLVLDPFSGSGTTALAALGLHRRAIGCEFSLDFLSLSLRRLCSNLVQVRLTVSSLQISSALVNFSVDPPPHFVDRSSRGLSPGLSLRVKRESCFWGAESEPLGHACMPSQFQLVRQERHFYFIGREDRAVIFSTLADSLEDAQQKFHDSGHVDSAALFIISTETTIYLA
jgi:hypothetical protein